jgi:hypothetical protein
MDPFCCQGAWDEMCVQQCQQCGGCGGCIPSCTGSDGQWRECGDDGCGGQCGTCPDGWQCNALYQCQPGSRTCQQGIDCVLSCNGPLYSCLDSCAAGLDQEAQSNLYRLFECIGNLCASGSGYLSPDCFYRYAKSECLPYYERCLSGVCTPRCEGRECGDDGCGGQCGTCPWGTACDWAAGYCYPTCIPSCENRQCGDDGCGGTCGDCQPGTTCQDGWCVSAGKACGEVLDCAMTNCASLTQACIQSCMVGASSSAQQLFLSLAQCVVQQCGYPTTAACVQKALQAACYSQAQSCRYDGWVVPM